MCVMSCLSRQRRASKKEQRHARALPERNERPITFFFTTLQASEGVQAKGERLKVHWAMRWKKKNFSKTTFQLYFCDY